MNRDTYVPDLAFIAIFPTSITALMFNAWPALPPHCGSVH